MQIRYLISRNTNADFDHSQGKRRAGIRFETSVRLAGIV